MVIIRCIVMRRVCDVCVIVFKQKTAYDMRSSDWSSDVCSSDLPRVVRIKHGSPVFRQAGDQLALLLGDCLDRVECFEVIRADRRNHAALGRSEEHTSELQSLLRSSYAVFCLRNQKSTRLHSTHQSSSRRPDYSSKQKKQR